MNIAISGADGFLGRHILSYLHGSHNVTAITLYPDLVRERFQDWDDLSIVLAKSNEIQKGDSLESVDVYIACAFPRASDSKHMGEGLDFVYSALTQLLKKRCKAVINISSQSVYNPNREKPAKETDPVVLTSTYAAAKYCVELSVAQMCKEKCVPYMNVRMASLIGAEFSERFVNKMTMNAINSGVIHYMEGNSRYAFLDVRDASLGIVRLAHAINRQRSGNINLGPSKSYTVEEYALFISDIVSQYTQNEITLVCDGYEENRLSSELDIGLLKQTIEWNERIAIHDTIKDIVENT